MSALVPNERPRGGPSLHVVGVKGPLVAEVMASPRSSLVRHEGI